MPTKRYTCAYAGFGYRHLQFANGLLTLENEEDQALLEAHPWFGIHIDELPMDAPPPTSRGRSRARQGVQTAADLDEEAEEEEEEG